MTTATLTAAVTWTRIRLNPNSPAVRRDLADAVDLHKTLMRLLPDDLGPHARQQAGLLFRLDHDPEPTLLIQTAQPPDLTRLPDTYGTAETRDLTPMLNALTAGQLVRYRITANATTRIPDPEHHHVGALKRGKVTPLHGEQALAWWHRRATHAGLALHTADATPCTFPRRQPGQPGPRHALTRFDGTAAITDPGSLTRALTTGIGKGKPYGAGLLTLAPA
jgi:CRISPR system Cascade subunit CasE